MPSNCCTAATPHRPLSSSFTLRVVYSKGTYIRSLAHDFGEALGTAAHMTSLRREAIGQVWQGSGVGRCGDGALGTAAYLMGGCMGGCSAACTAMKIVRSEAAHRWERKDDMARSITVELSFKVKKHCGGVQRLRGVIPEFVLMPSPMYHVRDAWPLDDLLKELTAAKERLAEQGDAGAEQPLSEKEH
eukprot:365861-Chlamydomonas_euryale.AAC.9